MKRFLQYVLVGAVVLATSCKKDDTRVFSEPADVRIQRTLDNFQAALDSAPDGWVATINTKEGGGYSFWMQFDDKNRVKMIGDFDSTTAVDVHESSFRLKALQQPTLIFDTYSYIHLLADPNRDVNGGSKGQGLVSDFEFYLTDTLIEKMGKGPKNLSEMALIGRYNETKLHLKRATAAEKATYIKGGLYQAISDFSESWNSVPNAYLKASDGNKGMLTLYAAIGARRLALTWVEGGKAVTKSASFAFTLNGIEILDSLPFGNHYIKGITKDKTGKKLICILTDGSSTDLLTADKPVVPIYLALGSTFNNVLIPMTTSYPGWSADFKKRFIQCYNNFAGTNRKIQQILMRFNTAGKTMDFYVTYLSGTSSFDAVFNYSYTISGDGKVKFTQTGMNGNAELHAAKMAPLLKDRLNSDTFQMDYFVDDENSTLALFTSIEHPDFVFTGDMYE